MDIRNKVEAGRQSLKWNETVEYQGSMYGVEPAQMMGGKYFDRFDDCGGEFNIDIETIYPGRACKACRGSFYGLGAQCECEVITERTLTCTRCRRQVLD